MTADGLQNIPGVRAGKLYHFRGLLGPKDAEGRQRWVFPPSDYRCLGAGFHYRVNSPLVVYVGINQPECGRLFLASLSDWWRDFVCLEPEKADPLSPRLGNAVVPDVAEWIGRRIIAFSEDKEWPQSSSPVPSATPE